ncbi:hypothetical protein HYV22_00285 [Candidatus Gottesmanbacteria bacterium]|nr:hypothetical protein [Candidatus Gottesmanbacteria bacterium]
MISISLLALFALVGVLIAAVVGVLAVIFLFVFKKGLNLKITTRNPPDETPPS